MKLFGRHQIVYQSTAASYDEKKKFRDGQLSLLGEVQHTNQRAARAIWSAVGILALTAGVIVAALIYAAPLLKARVEVLYIGRVDGQIQRINGIEGRPELFTDADAAREIREYVELYYDYTWETNRKHEDRIRMMSSADQLARYHAWADGEPNSPKQRLARHGSSDVERVVAHKQPDGDAKTSNYKVTFDYQETSNGRVEPTWHHYTGNIEFQHHPELVKDADWASKNPTGFYVTFFKATEDPK